MELALFVLFFWSLSQLNGEILGSMIFVVIAGICELVSCDALVLYEIF